MTQRFFIELMRRRGESMHLKMLLGVNPGQGNSTCRLFDAAPGRVTLEKLDLVYEPKIHTDAATAELAATELEEQIAGDRIELIASFPKLISLWKQAGKNDKVLNYRYLALDLHNTLGLYEDSLRYADGLPEMAKRYAPENEHRRWAIAGKLLNIYVGLMDVPTAVEFSENVILEFAQHNQARLGVMLYTLAMLYARYQKPRNPGKGEEYLSRGLAALEAARVDGSIAEGEFHFQSVFNRNGLAMIRNFQRRYPEAIQICRDCVDYLNAHLAADKHLLHRSVLLYNLAQVYNAIGSHEEAIEHYNAAIALDPNYSEYYNDRGSVYLRCGRLQDSEADYLKAIELSPPYFEVLTNLGQCYRLMGKMNKAVQSYSRALDIEPNQVLALLGRAKAQEESGDLKAAIEDYSSAIALDESLWDAFASRGIVHYENRNLKASLDDLNQALELKPDQGELFENRATVLTELGRHDKAEDDLRCAIALASSDADRAAVQTRLENLSGMKANK
jgi:tetratricopeptide (TPR) repeat protein